MYLDYIKKLQTDLGNNITKVEKIMLDNGTEAYKLYLRSPHNSKLLLIIFNKNPDSYYFSYYSATDEKFDKYLPVVNQMVHTFTFN